MYSELTEQEEFLAKEIVDAAYKVHKNWVQAYWKRFMKRAFAMNLN